ncbi:MAG: hypothetical protein ABW185_06145, partial [Sedimenticola sp.]
GASRTVVPSIILYSCIQLDHRCTMYNYEYARFLTTVVHGIHQKVHLPEIFTIWMTMVTSP